MYVISNWPQQLWLLIWADARLLKDLNSTLHWDLIPSPLGTFDITMSLVLRINEWAWPCCPLTGTLQAWTLQAWT